MTMSYEAWRQTRGNRSTSYVAYRSWLSEQNGGGTIPPPPSGGGGQFPAPTPATPLLPPSQGAASGYDFLQGGSPFFQATRPAPGRNSFRVYSIPGLNEVLRYEIYVEDLSGGLDLIQTRIDGGYVSNKLADSTLDSRHRRSLILPSLITSQTGTTPTGMEGVFSANFADLLAIGIGSGANVSLLRRTSNVNGALTALTFTPNGIITGLVRIHIAGGATDEQLAVLTASGAAEVLSDLAATPTSTGDMHASSADCWWMFESPLNAATPGAGTLIFQANNDIWTLSTAAAVGDAPTSVQTNIRDGGYGIGIIEIPGSPPRFYFVQPRTDETASMLREVGVVGDIFSVNFDGDDIQPLKISLPFMKYAAKWGNGIVYTDQKTVMYHNGAEQNLGWPRERVIPTDRQPRIKGFIILDENLFIVVEDVDAASVAALSYWVEQYIPEEQAWYQVTLDKTPTTSANLEATSGSFPVWQNTAATNFYRDNFVYLFEDTNNTFDRFSFTPPAWNPYYIARVTDVTEGNAGFKQEFASPGTARLPIYLFFPGFPKCVTDITWTGEFRGDHSQVEIEVAEQADSSMSFTGNQSAIFKEDDRWDRHFWKNPAPTTFDKLQLQVTLTQGTSGTGVAQTTPNALPFMVGGYIFLDGQYRDPAILEGWRFSWR